MMPTIPSHLSEEVQPSQSSIDSPTELTSFVRETSPPLFGLGTSQSSLQLAERKLAVNDTSPIVDEYGFVNKFACSRETYMSFRERYRASKDAMERNWKKLVTIKSSNRQSATPPPSIFRSSSKMLNSEYVYQPFSPTVKKAIREGIPAHLRPSAWFYYSGGEALRALFPNPSAVYESFLMQPKPAAFFMLTDRMKMDFRDILPTNQLIRKDYFSATNAMISETPDVGRVRIIQDRSESPDAFSSKPRRSTVIGLDQEAAISQPTLPTSAPFMSRLYNVLVAFFIFRPKVEYCRSLCTIAATLLLVIQDEERTFWTLSSLFANYASQEDSIAEEPIEFEDYRTPSPTLNVSKSSLSSSNSNQSSKTAGRDYKYFPPTMFVDTATCGYANRDGFIRILEKKKPVLVAELRKLDIPVPLLTTNWFQSLFIDVLPTEASMRVMDAFIGEGFKILYRVALALFFLNENELMSKIRPSRPLSTGFFASLFSRSPSPTAAKPDGAPASVILNLVKFMPKKQVDASALMECAFDGIGSLSMETILKECKSATVQERPLQSIRRFSQTAETRLTMDTIRRVSNSGNF